MSSKKSQSLRIMHTSIEALLLSSVYATYKDQWQSSFESFVALYQKN